MVNKKIKGIPYGVSDYGLIRDEDYYYVDKTRYLKEIEQCGRYLFFIRPRRFGKSLFISMIHYYCDLHFKERFGELFKGTWIYNNPSEERLKYMVLSLNFSSVSPEQVEKNFLDYVQVTVVDFLRKYKTILSANEKFLYFSEKIEKGSDASGILASLLALCNGISQSLYVIIDEYDNFTNTILSSSGEEAYRDVTHGDGFFRSFFNVLKAGTGGVDAPVKRLFITGVSPVTMDDVSSGFNIGENISRDFSLNRMLGFTEDDVTRMIEYYRRAGKISHTTDHLKDLMAQWYGNYIFTADPDTPLFNSDMALYFLKNYMKQQKLPEYMIDRNVRIDYGKLRHLIIIDQDINKPATNGNFSRLKKIIEEGGTSSSIADGFPLKEMVDAHNFNSLLFYFGLLTITGRRGSLYRLGIPNETVKHLYYDYIENAYRETGVFSLDLLKYRTLINDMALKGAWRPFFVFISDRMKKSLALRDLITGEKVVQTFLNVYLGLSDLFIIHSEKEMNQGYTDLVMEPFLAQYNDIAYSFLLELKYVKSGMKQDDPELKVLKNKAEEQVRGYALDEKFSKVISKTQLIKLVLIFSGNEMVHIDEA